MLPFLYLAGTGPLYFLIGTGHIDGQTFNSVAYPLRLWDDSSLHHRPQWFWESYNDYGSWWFRLAVKEDEDDDEG